jgi:hypothetical protein
MGVRRHMVYPSSHGVPLVTWCIPHHMGYPLTKIVITQSCPRMVGVSFAHRDTLGWILTRPVQGGNDHVKGRVNEGVTPSRDSA